MQNANLAATNTFNVSGIDAEGGMSWDTAQSWIAGMNTANYLGHNDWRLPAIDSGQFPPTGCNGAFANGGTACGWNVNPSSSELAHLFFDELGNLSAADTAGNPRGGFPGVDWGLVNSGPFTNFNTSNLNYWLGTAQDQYSAFEFAAVNGSQSQNGKGAPFSAWAVRPGDLSAVPVPASAWLLGSALIGLVGYRCKRNDG